MRLVRMKTMLRKLVNLINKIIFLVLFLNFFIILFYDANIFT